MSRRNENSSSSQDGSITTNATTASPSSPKLTAKPIPVTEPLYYGGFPGGPKLLARSSDDPFIRHFEGTYSVGKRLYNVGSHKIVQIFDNGPREEIRKILHSHQILWFTVNIIRIGYSETITENPVVLLVTVKNGTSQLHAQKAARDCHDCLRGYQFPDIHAEFMEMHSSESYSEYDSSKLRFLQETYESMPPIGTSIGPRLDGEYQASGSLGLYIQVKPRETENIGWQRCVLTCHHVVFPRGAEPPLNGLNKSFHRENGVRVFVDSPSAADHKISVAAAKETKESFQCEVTKLTARRDLADQGMEKTLNDKQLSALEKMETEIAKLSKKESIMESFNRSLGEVIATSGVKTDGATKTTLDWALIELDKARFSLPVTNSVPPFTFSSQSFTIMNSRLHQSDRLNPVLFELDVTQTIPLSEIKSPRVLDTDGSPSIRLLKFGRTTGWTFGVSNEIRSDCQRESGLISTEWCVLDRGLSSSQTNFSLPGDSGSFVFDYQGRLGGMIHAGTGIDEILHPMSFVTHIDHLFSSIKEEFDVKLEQVV